MNRLLVLAAGFTAGVATVIVGHVVAQVSSDGTATLECGGDFTEGGQLDCTIHDLVITPPVTTVPPTTTRPTTTTSTTSSSTSSTAPTTTMAPPTGIQFSEDFTGDKIADFTQRFDWEVVDLDRGDEGWIGHHDMACNGPDTERMLMHGPASNSDPGVEFWLCGPPGVTNDHLMSSVGNDHTFGIAAFSPKPSFTGNRICWDVNLTESKGRRLWWEVQVINANAVANEKLLANGGGIGQGMVGGADFERGTARLAWGRGVDGTFMKRPWPNDSVVFDFTEEMVRLWKGQTLTFNPGNSWEPGVRYATQDRATRAHHCMRDNGNGTLTLTQQRPGQPDYVRTVQASFPKPYRVIFSAQDYNAGKEGTQSNQTWHWDNILVSAN